MNESMHDNNLAGLVEPVHSVKSEIALLSALVQDAKCVDNVAGIVSDTDFYNGRHATIYIEILKMVTQGVPVDLISLSNELEKTTEITFSDVARITGSVGVPDNVKIYATEIANKAIERRLFTAGAEISDISYKHELSTTEKLDKANAVFAGVANKVKSDIMYSQRLATQWIDQMQHRIDHNGVLEGHATNFADLDDILCGLSPGDLVIVAGRPSMGKTSLALSIADEMLRSQKSVYIESIEMTSQKLMDRMISRRARVDLKKIRQAKKMSDTEWGVCSSSCCDIGNSKLTINEAFSPTVFDISSRARRVQRVQGLDLIIIDYLQLMGGGKSENETLRIAEITRGLKGMAKALKAPVMLLSQLNRSLEQRQDKRPMMSDLRQSGAIEQDADIILFPYRDVVYNQTTRFPNVAEIIVAKNRDGELGMVPLLFEGSYAGFYNYTGDYEVEEAPKKRKSGFDG